MKRKKQIIVITTIFLLTFSPVFSQGNSGGSNGNGPPFPCPPNNPVCGGQPGLPIDNGLSILFLVGTIFGVYNIYKNKHKGIKKPL